MNKATAKRTLRLSNETEVENKEQLKAIIDGCLQNDRRSQEQLFKLFYGKMLPVCIRYVSDRDTAQEVLQEGFIKIFEKLGAFDHKGSFEGWIRRIVANTAIDAIRKSKKDPYRTDNDNDFKIGAEDLMVDREEMETLDLKAQVAMEAVQKLSPAYRAVFNLYVLEEYSHKEIGTILGISEGTSKSNLAKAKMNLQKILSEKFMKID
ncbi:MAG: RNA polymerase sigma factor [Crocinitomicaceae bacterium]|nr:RNA polymerase sigma factor [Crocinitomicaceae bacterium]MDP5010569.1 RNA polymerase sigma factor [Crocinitomicaceae bacterium]